MDIEKEFQEIDFSVFSKVKENLFQRLLEARDKKVELLEEDLDFLAAAKSLPKQFEVEEK